MFQQHPIIKSVDISAVRYMNIGRIRAINSLIWTINSFTSVQARARCQVNYGKAFGFQSLLEFGTEDKGLQLYMSVLFTTNWGNNCASALVHLTADEVQMRVTCALPLKPARPRPGGHST